MAAVAMTPLPTTTSPPLSSALLLLQTPLGLESLFSPAPSSSSPLAAGSSPLGPGLHRHQIDCCMHMCNLRLYCM